MLENIRIVLVSPIYGGNVGSVCRAMANMDITDLAIADPRPFDPDEARKMACHSTHILDSRSEYNTLAEAVADCTLVIGTSARGGLYRDHAMTPREAAARAAAAAPAGKVAIVFGREDNGLYNDELACCTHVCQIPTSTRVSSLNLSQAVLVCCYEIFLTAGTYQPPVESSPEATSDFRERMFAMWRQTLLKIGFMSNDTADHMMFGLRRILSRGRLTVNDVKILMGIARQSEWAATEATRRSAQPPDPSGD